MKRDMAEVTKKDKKWIQPAEPLLAGRPSLAQQLTDVWWDDGAVREPCSMTIRVGADTAQISVNDTANKRSITTTAGTVEQALDLLEEVFASGRNAWRAWKQPQGKR